MLTHSPVIVTGERSLTYSMKITTSAAYSVVCSITYLLLFVHVATVCIVVASAAPTNDSSETVGSGVGTAASRRRWWNSLPTTQKTSLVNLFERSWFVTQLDQDTQIAYAYTAQQLYDFLESGADSDENDSYIGFSPMLLRASFHSAGTYTHRTGTGGTNGGTIFNHAELEDAGNACISKATNELFSIFHGNTLVPLPDTVVIGGVVALDVMNFPRMDLVAVTGGRMTVKNNAHRDLLPSTDDDPISKFQEQYGLTKRQTVALIGGAHNFGAAHGKCSGYVGQWTPTPLDWFGPDSSEPTFFSDLLQEDWRWYHVCTYENNNVSYTSIENPIGSVEEEHKEDEVHTSLAETCAIAQSGTPRICEDQAMRGCNFTDGVYSIDESPCDIDLLQLRLRSDFFLKVNPDLLPFSKLFARDPDLLAEEFGLAYHKITHSGLERCGLSGHGCAAGHRCKVVDNDPMTATCIFEGNTRLPPREKPKRKSKANNRQPRGRRPIV